MQADYFHFGWWTRQSEVFPHMSWMWRSEREFTQLESHRGTLPQMRQEDESGSRNDNDGRLKLYEYEKSSILSFIDFNNQYKRTDGKDKLQRKICEVWTKGGFSFVSNRHTPDD